MRRARLGIDLHTNGGVLKVNYKGDTVNFGEVWQDDNAITNVLSFHLVRQLVGAGNIGYDAEQDVFWARTPSNYFEFHPSAEGLYYYMPKYEDAHNFLKIQDETKRLYTLRQYRRALKAWKLLHAAGHPHPDDLVKLVQTNQIVNCPVRTADFKAAQTILGQDVGSLKGKTTRKKSVPVVEQVVAIPKELTLKGKVELCLDIVYVNKIPFLTTVSKELQYCTCKRIVPKGTKVDSFNAALDQVLRVYNRNHFKVTTIHADREFHSLLEPLEDAKSVVLNLAAAEEHVPEIECRNRMVKERVRACYHRLPYKHMPLTMLVAMVEDCAYTTNFFPLTAGVSSYYSPLAIVEKMQLDYEKHLKFSFGEYVQAPMSTTNTPKPRMVDCIYLSPV